MRQGLALGAAAIGLGIVAGSGGEGAFASPPSLERSPLPIAVVDVAGGGSAAIEPGAKVLHVVAFATWCRPCEDELPLLADWEARFRGDGYSLVIVALPRRQTRERLIRFLEERRPPGKLFLDASGALERALGIDGLPAHILFDREGRVRVRAGSLAEIDPATVETMLAERQSAEDASR